jgi:hypothetical protein
VEDSRRLFWTGLRPTAETLLSENVRFILRSELIVGRAHDGGRMLRAGGFRFALLVL